MQKFNKPTAILFFFILIGALLHFYNLNWGSPIYFHPDERNIASSVSQLQLPTQMNPHFFAYGSLPIYAIYFTGLLFNYIFQFLNPNPYTLNPSFEQAILISRFYSAFFATLLIPILFFIGKKLKDKKTGIIAAFLATTSVGFIQFAHFGTFEMWLTFFSVLLFWICLQKINNKTVLLIGIVFGILMAIKVSSLTLFPIILLTLLIQNARKTQKIRYIKLSESQKIRLSGLLGILSFLKNIIIIILIAFVVYYLTNPFVFLDFKSFKNSMDYESSLAIGTLPVFYTGEFFNTTPITFQFINIYPFLLNPLITILFIPALLYVFYKTVKTKNISFMILTSLFMILFLSQAFLFAKWTRYMVPTLPFIYLIITVALTDFLRNKRQQFSNLTIITIIIINTIFAISYFITVFIRQDSRIAAKEFAIKNIPSNAQILSEVYDMGIVPFNRNFPNITLFNFYDLDNNSPDATIDILTTQLSSTDYIILPSQRILKTRLLKSDKFPKGNMFYKGFLNNKLEYQKIYETPCDIFCKITYLEDPVFSFEQTANVFDRPTVFIFKKM